MKYVFSCALIVVIALAGCYESSSQGGGKLYEKAVFKNYWYAGKAEIGSYTLRQSRYGEERVGKAVLIFVTEDFSQSKHVKLDNPAAAGPDKASVLKLNFTKNFVTGIYPYSMMLSVFTPVQRHEHAHSLKAAMSAQEWCGQVFTQLNLKGDAYAGRSFSYFEQEGDEEFELKKSLLEDEVWNIIRLDHRDLPTGNIAVIPGLFFTRLQHVDMKVQQAVASRVDSTGTSRYTLAFPDQQRTLEIVFENTFPYTINAWTETFHDREGKTLRTSATLDKTMVTDYWTRNKNADQPLRDSLNLR